MVKKDLKEWKKFREGNGNTITHEEYLFVCNLHAKCFDHKLELPCKCSPKRINIMIEDLNRLYVKST
jgi:hypothetical protein